MDNDVKRDNEFMSGLGEVISEYDEEEEEDKMFRLEEIPQVSKSPKINELHFMGTLTIQGKLKPEIFESKVNSEKIRFLEIYKNFLQIYQKSDLPEDLDIQARKVFQSMEKYDKALEELGNYFETYDPHVIESGLNQALTAIYELTDSYEIFVNKQSPSLTKKCLDCGHPNPLGTIQCVSCNYIFTLSNEEISLEFYSQKWKGKESPFSLGAAPFPGSIIEAFDNYDRLVKGMITKEKYLEGIDWIITQIELSRQKTEREQYKAPPEAMQATGLLFDGMDHGKKGLEKLRDKVLWDNYKDLSPEWNKLLLAIHLILKAQSIYQFLSPK